MFIGLVKLLLKLFFFTGKISCNTAFKKPLDKEEEKLFFSKAKMGDKAAENVLVEHNLRLVAHIVKKYKNTSYDSDELISVGSFGLLKAIRSYDENSGNNFSTYASKCITNEILMMIRYDKKRSGDIYLDTEISKDKDGNGITLSEVLMTNSNEFEDEVENRVALSDIILVMKKVLNKREQMVINLRFGLENNLPMSQSEVAEILGISRSYVSRIESHAILVIKEYYANNIPIDK